MKKPDNMEKIMLVIACLACFVAFNGAILLSYVTIHLLLTGTLPR
jgi:hypothetical protein